MAKLFIYSYLAWANYFKIPAKGHRLGTEEVWSAGFRWKTHTFGLLRISPTGFTAVCWYSSYWAANTSNNSRKGMQGLPKGLLIKCHKTFMETVKQFSPRQCQWNDKRKWIGSTLFLSQSCWHAVARCCSDELVMDCLFGRVWFIIRNWEIIEYWSNCNKLICQTLCVFQEHKCQLVSENIILIYKNTFFSPQSFHRHEVKKEAIKKRTIKHVLFYLELLLGIRDNTSIPTRRRASLGHACMLLQLCICGDDKWERTHISPLRSAHSFSPSNGFTSVPSSPSIRPRTESIVF